MMSLALLFRGLPGGCPCVVLGPVLLAVIAALSPPAEAQQDIAALFTRPPAKLQDAREGTRRMIGVVTQRPDAALAAQLGVDADASLVVAEVSEGLPAHEAGVAVHDVIVGVDGGRGVTQQSLREAIAARDAGQTISLTLLRRGEEQMVAVKVAERKVADLFGRVLEEGGEARATLERAFAEQAELSRRVYGNLQDASGGASHLAESQAELARRRDELAAAEARLAESLALLEREAAAKGEAGAAARERQVREREERDVIVEQLRSLIEQRRGSLDEAVKVLGEVQSQQEQRRKSVEQAMQAVRDLEARLAERMDSAVILEGVRDGKWVLPLPLREAAREAGTGWRGLVLGGGEAAGVHADAVNERLDRIEQRLARIEELLSGPADVR